MRTYRNDEITLEEIEALKPDHICVSPGPCSPKEAGILRGRRCSTLPAASRCWARARAIRPSARPSAAR
ncbi:hypothetical protein ACU4GD_38300 [Cupriavidus basilensis]